jgi:hypothetical protein
MTTISPTLSDWLFLGIYVITVLICIPQSWINLKERRISSFSFDALGYFLVIKFAGTKSKQRAKALTKDYKRIQLLGLFAVLLALGALYNIYNWVQIFGKP